MIYTTKTRIVECGIPLPSTPVLLLVYGGVLPFSVIVEREGLDFALLCTRSAPEYNHIWLKFANWCLRNVNSSGIEVAKTHAYTLAECPEMAAQNAAGWGVLVATMSADGGPDDKLEAGRQERELQKQRFLKLVS